MIFGRSQKGILEMVCIGLSAENIAKLQAGEPMSIGPMPKDPTLKNVSIIIVAGETNEDIMERLKKSGVIE